MSRLTHSERKTRRRLMAADARDLDARQVADKYGCTLKTVYDACAENGVEPIRPPIKPRPASSSLRIVGLLFAGYSISDVARRLSISVSRVADVKAAAVTAGIPIPGAARVELQQCTEITLDELDERR